MRKRQFALFAGATCVLASLLSPTRTTAAATDVSIDIPFQRFVLTNGLTLIVHEDHKAPIVAVNVWYHVGSKNEKPGRTGFAHLFEHLMFSGSEHFQEGGSQRAFFEAMERIGATDLNGTTSEDRTDFFENVPKNALDVALWLESDRMGHLLGAVDQAKLDVQRGVVQNEKRQRENQPYGITDELITKGTAPPGHPYSWTVIGSMEDLEAASLEDVQTWFKSYYGAANAVLVMAGDIDAETALKKAEHYFGSIPSGPPIAKFDQWIPRIAGTRRQSVSDRVPQARIYKVWNVPRYGEPDTIYLQMASDVFSYGGTKTSRLYQRLVYEEQLATDVTAYVEPNEISGRFNIQATARPGVDLARVEKALDEELAKFLSEGPTAKELERVKAQETADFVRGIERIGGFGGKSDVLAEGETYRGQPDFYKTWLKYMRNATTGDLQRAARQWLTTDVYVLEVHPFPEFETSAAAVDRTQLPEPGTPPEIRFPELKRATLSNGLKVIMAERHATPIVSLNLQLDAGSAADQFAVPGTARLAMEMIDAGTAKRTALQISEDLASLGAALSAGTDLDTCSVNLSSLTSTLDSALAIYADVILNPSFPQSDFDRLQKQALARIQREKAEPVTMATRVFPRLLYGPDHAYGNPLTGSGTERSVSKITRADMRQFHDAWFKPNHATLMVVGDTTLAEITPKLEKLFGQWKPGDIPSKNISTVAPPSHTQVYVVDRPGSIQSIIFAGAVAPPKANPDEIAIETLNHVLGGAFTSRINLNLREDKHWAYGAHSILIPAKGQRPFIAYAPVQLDKTSEAMEEIDKELRDVLELRPVTSSELSTAQNQRTLRLPGAWETDNAVLNAIAQIVRFGLPDDYFTMFPAKVRALTLKDMADAAVKLVHPNRLIWVVVGDRARIEPEIKKLGWADIQLLDADGNRL